MPVFLRDRAAGATERMDDPNCDPGQLRTTYRQFRVVNALVSRARAVYQRWFRPAMTDPDETYSLLDIGFGGGDITCHLARWAAGDGWRLQVTGIEIDARAVAYASSQPAPPSVRFRHASAADLARAGERFDFVFSNHVLHHLSGAAERDQLLDEAGRLARRVAVMVDLERRDAAYALFSLLSLPVALRRQSYLRADGLASIARSYTLAELRAVAPPGWHVERLFPFHLALWYRHGC